MANNTPENCPLVPRWFHVGSTLVPLVPSHLSIGTKKAIKRTLGTRAGDWRNNLTCRQMRKPSLRLRILLQHLTAKKTALRWSIKTFKQRHILTKKVQKNASPFLCLASTLADPMVPSLRMAKVLPDPNHPVFSRLAPTATIIPLEVMFTSGKVGNPKKIDINKEWIWGVAHVCIHPQHQTRDAAFWGRCQSSDESTILAGLAGESKMASNIFKS